MAYRFKLEQIRHLREQERKQVQLEYAESLQKLARAEAKLAEAVAEQTAAERSALTVHKARARVQQLKDWHNYLNSVEQKAERHRLTRDRLHKHVQTVQSDLRERRISEQVMNQLRKSDYAAYCYQMKKRDAKQMDEINVTRYGRGRHGGIAP